MKNIKPLKIFELNRYSKWIGENPDTIKKFPDLNEPSSFDGDEKLLFRKMINGSEDYHKILNDLKNKIPSMFLTLKKVESDDIGSNIENNWKYERYNIFNILIEGHSDLKYKFNGRYYYKDINWKNFDEIYSLIVKKVFYGNEEEIDQEKIKIIKIDWDLIIKSLISFKKKKKYITNRALHKARKIAKMKKIDWDDFVSVMAWVEHFRSGSYRKIPKEIYEALNYLTVNPNNYPKTIYRGLFYDGVKIKDEEKFKKKWYKGSKPGLKNRKATSWTTNIEVAKSFMTNQDNVKDYKNGYHVLLKYDVQSANDLVADFTDWEWMTFWNQQEVMLNPNVKDYEVLEIFPYSEGGEYKDRFKTQYGKFLKSGIKGKAYAGAWGLNIDEIKRRLFDIGMSKLPQHHKYEIMKLKDNLVSKLNINFNKGFENLNNLRIPLYVFLDILFIPTLNSKVLSPDSIITHFTEKLNIGKNWVKSSIMNNTNKIIYSILEDGNIDDTEDLRRKHFGWDENNLKIDNVKIDLINNDIYNFTFKIDVFNSKLSVNTKSGEKDEIINKEINKTKNKNIILKEFIEKYKNKDILPKTVNIISNLD